MRSFGLYYKQEEEIECTKKDCPYLPNREALSKQTIEVHCNLWKVLKKRWPIYYVFCNPKYEYFLDFGLLFSPEIREIVLHLPFEFKEEGFEDLGKKLDSQELSSLIFNENVKTSCSAGTFHMIQIDDKIYYVYPLSSQNCKFPPTEETDDKKHRYKGTNLQITVTSTPDKSILPIISEKTTQGNANEKDDSKNKGQKNPKTFFYLRFRLKLEEAQLKNIRKEEALSSDILQSIFSKNEMFDFRINDDREINRKIDEELRHKCYMPFEMTKVHFFFMSDTRNDVSNASSDYDTRFLETEKWEEYVDRRIPESMLAYHWKEKKERVVSIQTEPMDVKGVDLFGLNLFSKIPYTNLLAKFEKGNPTFSSFKLFFMLTYPHRSWVQILFYVLIVVFLGCLGSLGASYLFVDSTTSVTRSLWEYLSWLGGCLIVIFIFGWCLKVIGRVRFR